jgi:hypothetical protein
MYKATGYNHALDRVREDMALMLNLEVKIIQYDTALMNSNFYTEDQLATIQQKRADTSRDFIDLLNKYNIKND